MRATGMPDWMVRIVALHAASTEGNGQMPATIDLRNAVQLERDFRDDAKRAFGAHEKACEIVTGG